MAFCWGYKFKRCLLGSRTRYSYSNSIIYFHGNYASKIKNSRRFISYNGSVIWEDTWWTRQDSGQCTSTRKEWAQLTSLLTQTMRGATRRGSPRVEESYNMEHKNIDQSRFDNKSKIDECQLERSLLKQQIQSFSRYQTDHLPNMNSVTRIIRALKEPSQNYSFK